MRVEPAFVHQDLISTEAAALLGSVEITAECPNLKQIPGQ